MKKIRFGDLQGESMVAPWSVTQSAHHEVPVRVKVAAQRVGAGVETLSVAISLENAKMLARSLEATVREIEQARAADDAHPF